MDYTKQCWFCKKVTMEPIEGYYKCSDCGATWNSQPADGTYMDIEAKRDGARGGSSYTPAKKSRRQTAKKAVLG